MESITSSPPPPSHPTAVSVSGWQPANVCLKVWKLKIQIALCAPAFVQIGERGEKTHQARGWILAPMSAVQKGFASFTAAFIFYSFNQPSACHRRGASIANRSNGGTMENHAVWFLLACTTSSGRCTLTSPQIFQPVPRLVLLLADWLKTLNYPRNSPAISRLFKLPSAQTDTDSKLPQNPAFPTSDVTFLYLIVPLPLIIPSQLIMSAPALG